MPMDIRLKQLSYSSRLLLHKCPRKYQLYRLNSKVEQDDDIPQSVTFAFGHTVGLGIQELLEHNNLDKTIWACFLMWEPDLLAENEKQKKSFWLAISAIQKFQSICANGFLDGWQLVEYKEAPAVELSFIVSFPNGYTYKGFVDAVLENKETGEVMVLEVKTSSGTFVNAASYKNSAQAIGYSIVLDALFPSLSSYLVKYLVYKTKQAEFEVMDFHKDYLARALWIREILLDIEFLDMCSEADVYPMHGESCFDFYRECEYLSLCTLSTAALTEPLGEEEEAKILEKNKTDFQVSLSLNDLITTQLSKE